MLVLNVRFQNNVLGHNFDVDVLGIDAGDSHVKDKLAVSFAQLKGWLPDQLPFGLKSVVQIAAEQRSVEPQPSDY